MRASGPDGDVMETDLHDYLRAFCRRLTTLLGSEQLDWYGDVIKVSATMGITVRKAGESLRDLQQRAEGGSGLADSGPRDQIEA